MNELLLIFPILALAGAPALWLILGRPRWLTENEASESPQSISIVVPARDEEENLPRLLDSIKNLTGPVHEVIVVDDGSSDGTGGVAEEFGATVVTPDSPPAGWRGKSWACTRGAEQATGDWLLFLDADTVLETGALSAFQELIRREPGVFSLCPWHTIGKPYEEFSAFFNVLMLAGSNAFMPFPRARHTLFGQCLFVKKCDYERVGTHEVVRDETLENVQLTPRFAEAGIPVFSFLGKGVVTMRMFPEGLPTLRRSWLKGARSGAAGTDSRTLLWASIWLSGLMFTLISLAILSDSRVGPTYAWLTAAAYLSGVAQCAFAFRLAGNFSILNALFFPLALIFYQGLFFTALIREKIGLKATWKGRTFE